MVHAVYPGEYNPFTKRNMDILLKASSLFQTVTVLIRPSASESLLLSGEEKCDILHKCLSGYGRVLIDQWDGLLTDYMKINQKQVIIEDLHSCTEFDRGFSAALMRKKTSEEIETVFLSCSDEIYVSPLALKELYDLGGDIRPFVTNEVSDFLYNRLRTSALSCVDVFTGEPPDGF